MNAHSKNLNLERYINNCVKPNDKKEKEQNKL